MTHPDAPRLVFRHLDDEPWREVKAQRHGERRVSVWEKWLDRSPRLLAIYARYDPGMTVERHGHMSDHLVFVLEGEVTIGDRHCPAGTHVTLEEGARFGPIVAGSEGAVLYEVMMGDPRAVPADPDGFRTLCDARGIEPLPNPPLLRPSWAKPRLD